MNRIRNLIPVLLVLLLLQAWGSRAAQAGYTLVSSDTFARSDTAYGSPGNGLVDATGNTWGVKSGQLKVDTAVNGSVSAPCVRPSLEGTISGKVRATISDSGNSPGVVGRYFVSGGQASDYNAFLYSGGTQLYINSLVAGTYHQGSPVTISPAITAPVIMELSWVQSTDGASTLVTVTFYNPTTQAQIGSAYSITDSTMALQGQAGVGGVQVYNLYASFSELDTYSYSPGGAIAAGTIGIKQITDHGPNATYGWSYQSPLKNSITVAVTGASGGYSALTYTYQWRVTGSGTWTTAGGAAQSTAEYSFGLTAPPGSSYDIQVIVGDGSGTPTATTPPLTIHTPTSVILFSGDSTTYGINFENTGTPFASWPYYGQTALAGSGVYVAAINGGEPGAASTTIVSDATGGLVVGSGTAARFRQAISDYIDQYGIDTICFRAGANNVRDDNTGNDTASVASVGATYTADVLALSAACQAKGIKLLVDCPFYIPFPSGSGGQSWTAPDPYLSGVGGINASIAALDQSWACILCSADGYSGVGSYQEYCTNHTGIGLEVHPPAAFYVSYGAVWAADYITRISGNTHVARDRSGSRARLQ